jgi:predicted RND superfamily exporter protein
MAVIGLASLGMRDLTVDYSVEQFFPTWGPERDVFDEYRSVFTGEDAQVVFFLETGDALEPSEYHTLEAVADSFRAAELDDVAWAGDLPGVAEASMDADGLAAVLRPYRSQPLLSGFFWSPDASVHTVQAVLPPELNNDADRRALTTRLEEAVDGTDPADRWTLSGTPVIRAQVPELLEFDQSVLLGGGILLFFVVLYVFFGQGARVVLALAAVLPAYLVTLALMALSGTPVTVLTSFIPIVILVVGVCDSTHLLAHFDRDRSEGLDPRSAAASTFAALATSCFFTSLTTALGFASLMATGIEIIGDFGLFTALAVMITFGFSVSVLPALLSLGKDVPAGPRPAAARTLVDPLVRLARRAGTLDPRMTLLVFGSVALICLIAGSTIGIDTYLVDDLKDDTRVIQDLRWIERSGFGLFQTNVFLRGDGERLDEPAMLAWMERLQRYVEDEPIVLSTVGLPDVANAPAIPGVGTEALFRPDEDAAQVVIVVRDAGSRATLPFLDRVDAWISSNPPPVGAAEVTGTVRMAHMFSFHVLRSFGPSIVLALVLIWVVMTLLFRSVRLGLLALVPNLFPLVALVGVMALLGVALKPSSILVFSIAFGIAVDDSIHLMGRFTHLVRKGFGTGSAVRTAVRETGAALVMSTIVVSSGFALLLASRFELLYLVGLLTAVTALTALLADLVLFPALLRMAPVTMPHVEAETSEAVGGSLEPSTVPSA